MGWREREIGSGMESGRGRGMKGEREMEGERGGGVKGERGRGMS